MRFIYDERLEIAIPTLNANVAGEGGLSNVTPMPSGYPKMDWTPERERELKDLIASGHSRGQVAKLFGCSRNAVVGKADRLGLGAPPIAKKIGAMKVNARKKDLRTLRRMVRRRWPPKPMPSFAATNEPEPLRVSLLELNETHCRWVCEGTDDNCLPTYCGHQCVANSPWCAHHYRRVHES